MTDVSAHEARQREMIENLRRNIGPDATGVMVDAWLVLAVLDERDEARALVEQMREALREEVKKRHHYTDGSQPDDAWLDAKIAEMYPALAPAVEGDEPMTMAHLCGHDCERVCGYEADTLRYRIEAADERVQELTNALQRIYDWSRDGTLGPETFKRAARLEARAALVPAEKPPRAEGAWGKPYADAMRFVPEGDERCDEPKDACRCMKRKGHDGSHACAHGTWFAAVSRG